jgi:hypothetical protein
VSAKRSDRRDGGIVDDEGREARRVERRRDVEGICENGRWFSVDDVWEYFERRVVALTMFVSSVMISSEVDG